MMGKLIDMESGDGIRIDTEVSYLFQRCCDCGKRHRITIEWETKDGKPAVTLRYYSEPAETEVK